MTSRSPGGEWNAPRYKVVDEDGNVIPRRYYATDLQQVNKDTLEISTEPRPNYSKEPILNEEASEKALSIGGEEEKEHQLPPTQVQERRTEFGRLIKQKSRLIDELLIASKQRKEKNTNKNLIDH